MANPRPQGQAIPTAKRATTVKRPARPDSAGAAKQVMRIPQLPWLDFSPTAMQTRATDRASSDLTGLAAALPTADSIQRQYEPQMANATTLGNAVADHLRAAGQWQAGLGQTQPQIQTTLGAPVAQAAGAAAAGQGMAYGQANSLGSAGDAASLRGLAQSQLLQRQEQGAFTDRASQLAGIEARRPGIEAGYMDQERTLANQQNIARYNGSIAMLQTEANLGVKEKQLLADLKKAKLAYGLGEDKLAATSDYNAGQLVLGRDKLDATITHWSAQDRAARTQAAAAYYRAHTGGSSPSKQDETWLLRASAAADGALKGASSKVGTGTAKVTYSVPPLDPLATPTTRTTQVPVAITKQGPAAVSAWIARTYQIVNPQVGLIDPEGTTTKATTGSYQDVYRAALNMLRIHYAPDVAAAMATRIAKSRMNPPKPPPQKTAPRSPNAPG